MVGVNVPLVVCVSSDRGIRERVVRRLGDCGAVLICADLDELRAMLFPVAPLVAEREGPNGAVLRLAHLELDPIAHRVTWRGEPLPLTRLEREVLARLAEPPLGVWTYQRLFSTVWGSAYLGDTAILHSAVKRLRRKLRSASGDLAIETVRGVGYRLAVAR